jgi:hypothetical protein
VYRHRTFHSQGISSLAALGETLFSRKTIYELTDPSLSFMIRFLFLSCENQPCGITKWCVAVHIIMLLQFASEKTIAIASPVAKDKGSQTRTLKQAHAQQVVSLARASCAPPPLSGRPWAGPRVPVGGAAAPWGLRRFSPSWPLGGGVLRLTSFFDQRLSIGTSYVQHQHSYQENRDILCPAHNQ